MAIWCMSKCDNNFYRKLNTLIDTPNFLFDPKTLEHKFKGTKKIKDSSLPYILPYSKDVIHNHFKKLFKDYNLRLEDTHYLITPPYTKQSIHVDSLPNYIISCKLNITISNENQPFVWYKKVDYNNYKFQTSAGRGYLTSMSQDEIEIERHNVNGVYLINTSYPHRTINNDSAWRFCLTTSIRNKKGKFITFKEAVEIFKDYIV